MIGATRTFRSYLGSFPTTRYESRFRRMEVDRPRFFSQEKIVGGAGSLSIRPDEVIMKVRDGILPSHHEIECFSKAAEPVQIGAMFAAQIINDIELPKTPYFDPNKDHQSYQLFNDIASGSRLTKDQIVSFIQRVVTKEVKPEFLGMFLMAVRINGLSNMETAWLTEAMTKSGKILDLSQVPGNKVDKHASGGVSEFTSAIIGPLVATFGLVDPMMSGRRLQHTGGTLDKLESIPGFRVSLSEEEIIKNLQDVGIAIFSQTDDIAPADKILYAARAKTGTVDSIPLICGSIVSKKLAAGPNIVFLVTTGNGAFMDKYKDAKQLAEMMVASAKNAGKNASAIIASMDQPLAPAVGNSIEMRQAFEILKGKKQGFRRLIDLAVECSTHMLIHGGIYRHDDIDAAREELENRLANGAALKKFREMVIAQGGDARVIDNYHLLPQTENIEIVVAPKTGFVQSIDTKAIGWAEYNLTFSGGEIDRGAGLEVFKFPGDLVVEGQPLAVLNYTSKENLPVAMDLIRNAYTIGEEKVEQRPLILETIW